MFKHAEQKFWLIPHFSTGKNGGWKFHGPPDADRVSHRGPDPVGGHLSLRIPVQRARLRSVYTGGQGLHSDL